MIFILSQISLILIKFIENYISTSKKVPIYLPSLDASNFARLIFKYNFFTKLSKRVYFQRWISVAWTASSAGAHLLGILVNHHFFPLISVAWIGLDYSLLAAPWTWRSSSPPTFTLLANHSRCTFLTNSILNLLGEGGL